MRTLAGLGLLLLLPLAWAGSPEHPELSDDPGDIDSPNPFLPVGGDLLKAWFHDDTETEVRLTLEVARLEVAHPARFDVYWQVWPTVFNAVPVEVQWVARATVTSAEDVFELWRYEDEDLERVQALTGSAQPGSPGHITWTLPYEAMGARPGNLLRAPQATADVTLPQVAPDGGEFGRRTDEASSPYSFFQLRLADRLAGFQPPTRLPDGSDESSDSKVLDVRDLWIDFSAETLDITFSIGALTAATVAQCPAEIMARLGDADDYGVLYAIVRVRGGPNGTQGIEYVDTYEDLEGAQLLPDLQLGEPAFVRWRIPRSEWPGGDLTTFMFHIVARLDCPGEYLGDSFTNWGHEDEIFGLPGAPALAALAAVVGAVLARRR